MKLPNGAEAIVDIRKIREYCLSTEHPRGKHKAQVFAVKLGMTVDHWENLKDALRQAAQREDAIETVADEYGNRYIIDFELKHEGRSAMIRSCWMIRTGEMMPRFVTCWVI